ncbi:MAG: SIS domain-containing protein [Chitinispirillaceae bacterium]|nr:SIS domain-containing protein [Chitinispirillaceae bacterium]
MENLFNEVVKDHLSVVQMIQGSPEIVSEISVIARMALTAFHRGHKLLLCGNGGSAADAQHIACELVGRFFLERRALDAEALNVNTSSLTAIGNDYSIDYIFARQVEAKGKPGDVLLGITTSGTSKNIIAAFEAGRRIGLKNVCLTGEKAPASLDALCDAVIRVPSSCTPRIQEVHILLGHILCEYVEKELFGGSSGEGL